MAYNNQFSNPSQVSSVPTAESLNVLISLSNEFINYSDEDLDFVDSFNYFFEKYSGNARQKYEARQSIGGFGLATLREFKKLAQEGIDANANKNEGLAIQYLFFFTFIEECIDVNEERYQEHCEEEDAYYSNLIFD